MPPFKSIHSVPNFSSLNRKKIVFCARSHPIAGWLFLDYMIHTHTHMCASDVRVRVRHPSSRDLRTNIYLCNEFSINEMPSSLFLSSSFFFARSSHVLLLLINLKRNIYVSPADGPFLRARATTHRHRKPKTKLKFPSHFTRSHGGNEKLSVWRWWRPQYGRAKKCKTEN